MKHAIPFDAWGGIGGGAYAPEAEHEVYYILNQARMTKDKLDTLRNGGETDIF